MINHHLQQVVKTKVEEDFSTIRNYSCWFSRSSFIFFWDPRFKLLRLGKLIEIKLKSAGGFMQEELSALRLRLAKAGSFHKGEIAWIHGLTF